MINTILEQLINLAALNARETANLLNNGDPFNVASTEPGSQSRANELRGLARGLERSFASLPNKQAWYCAAVDDFVAARSYQRFEENGN